VDLERTIVGESEGNGGGGLEDFTTYAEVDPTGTGGESGHVQFTANHIDHYAIKNEDAYLYDDKDAGHFTNFEHRFRAKSDFGDSWSLGGIWMLSNEVDDPKGLDLANKDFILLFFEEGSTGSHKILLRECDAGTFYDDIWTSPLADTWYYFIVTKSGTSFSVEIRTGSYEGSLQDTLTLTLQNDYAFRYIFACTSWNSGSGDWMNTDIENLDLQEGDGELYPENLIIRDLEASYEVKLYDSVDSLVCNASANSEGLANMTLPLAYRNSNFTGTFRVYNENSTFVYSKWFEDVRGGDEYTIRTKSGGLSLGLIALIVALLAFVIALASKISS